MKIETVATNVISIWEHGGLYTCHGNGAYGLIGFQWDNVTRLLEHYVHGHGKLDHDPSWYAGELLRRAKTGHTHDERIIPELDKVARDPLMQKTQRYEAYQYMRDSINIQKRHFDFKMPLSQLILCDMGVNNGQWNKYVEDVDVSGKSEYDVIWAAQEVRIDAVKRAGEWHYKGLQHRYLWYQHLCKSNHHLTMKKFMPVLEVNGVKVKIGTAIEPL